MMCIFATLVKLMNSEKLINNCIPGFKQRFEPISFGSLVQRTFYRTTRGTMILISIKSYIFEFKIIP